MCAVLHDEKSRPVCPRAAEYSKGTPTKVSDLLRFQRKPQTLREAFLAYAELSRDGAPPATSWHLFFEQFELCRCGVICPEARELAPHALRELIVDLFAMPDDVASIHDEQHRDVSERPAVQPEPSRPAWALSGDPDNRSLTEIIDALVPAENWLREQGLYSEQSHHTIYAPEGLCSCSRCPARMGGAR